MSSLQGQFLSSEDVVMSSNEIDPFIEECRNFVQKSKNPGPEDMTKKEISERIVDSLAEDEIDNIRKKVFSCWETSKMQHRYGEVVETPKVTRLQDSEPTTQSEEAVISFEDAKSEVASAAKRRVQRYDIEQLIEAELKDIEAKRGASSPVIESMDFTEIETKVADLPGIAGIELRQQKGTSPILKRTDVLKVLLRIYDYSNVGSAERSVTTSIEASETGYLSAHEIRNLQEFRKHIVDEMKTIYKQLTSAYPLEIHRATENVETSNSSSSSSHSKDSSFSKIKSAIHPMSPLELSTSAYPEMTTRSQTVTRDEDDTISSLPFSKLDSNTDSSAQLKSSTSSDDLVTDTNTSSTTISSEENTLSGISSLPTDPRVSVSSWGDVDPRASVSSQRDLDSRTSVSIYPRTSVSSVRDLGNKTSVSSLKDLELFGAVMSPSFLSQQLLSGDEGSDDAFLTVPLVPTTIANPLPSPMDSAETAQNTRRRGRSSKEDEDKKEAKRPAP